MVKKMSAKALIAELAVMVLFIALIFAVRINAASAMTISENSELTKVRFGTVEQEGYSMRDENGIVRGFDAEYMAKISQYGLMDLEYHFYDNFEELLSALEKGEIDMAAGVAKTKEREGNFIFSSKPIMDSAIVIAVPKEDDFYEYGNVDQISEMKLGANAGSYMANISDEWQAEYGTSLNIIKFDSEEEMRAAVDSGKVDGMIVASGQYPEYRSIFEPTIVGFYVCMNKGRSDLKEKVDDAINRILKEDIDYFDTVINKYRVINGAAVTISAEEKEFLKKHFPDGNIYVAVLRHDPPYYSLDDGEEKGIIPDYYNLLAKKINSNGLDIKFKFVTYRDNDEIYDAVTNYRVDMLGYTGMDSTDASALGVILTGAYDNQMMAIIIPAIDQKNTEKNKNYSASDNKTSLYNVAVQKNDAMQIRYYLRLKEINYKITEYDSLEKCYKKMEKGECDGVVTTLTKANWIINQNRSGDVQIQTVECSGWNYAGAVTPDHYKLASVISKAAYYTAGDMAAIEAENSEAETDFMTVIRKTPLRVIFIMFALTMVFITGIIILIAYTSHIRMKRSKDYELIESQNKLIDSYRYDHVTGLMNRESLMTQVGGSLDKTEKYAVILMDLDNFREINESYSFEEGNLVLRDIAERMRKFCGYNVEDRIPARYSGAEFVLVLRRGEADKAEKIAKNIAGLSKRPTVIKGFLKIAGIKDDSEKIWFHTKVGIGYSDGVSEFKDIVKNAGIALAYAKEGKDKAIGIYEDKLKDRLFKLNEIKAAIVEALENDGFYMMYQPQVNLQRMEVSGYEALIRMKRGDIYPGQFIPVAESQGYIKQIGRKSTELVIRQIAEWKKEGKALRPVSINFSSNQLNDMSYVDYLLELCQQYDVDTSLVEIEITESLLFKQDTQTSKFFDKLKEVGIKMLLDDFGTGYSSLRYLTYIPVDYVKLDKSIVDACLNRSAAKSDVNTNAFISGIIDLTHCIGKKIIVEGVEEEWQTDLLKEFGCDTIQGYYFSKPLLPSDAAEFEIKENK
ncbi:EAL domain-containing protein [Lachnospiraceae bacterium C1.1]|nr:EAL domain-containing protein [Lachnospiraceae bacterium C1.1]